MSDYILCLTSQINCLTKKKKTIQFADVGYAEKDSEIVYNFLLRTIWAHCVKSPTFVQKSLGSNPYVKYIKKSLKGFFGQNMGF